MTFLPPYAPDLNPVEFLWAWLKRHALANFCPADLGELTTTARNKLKSAQHRPSIISACWAGAGQQHDSGTHLNARFDSLAIGKNPQTSIVVFLHSIERAWQLAWR